MAVPLDAMPLIPSKLLQPVAADSNQLNVQLLRKRAKLLC